MKISKLDAAKRQLDSAIKLWFDDEDPVTICSLTWSSFQIIQDKNDKPGGDKAMTLLAIVQSIVEPEHVTQTMAKLRQPWAFFKHANQDPHAILEFDPASTEIFISLSIAGLRALGEGSSDVQRTFTIWNNLHVAEYGIEFKKSLAEKFPPHAIESAKRLPKKKFIESVLLLLTQERLGKL